MNAIADDIRDAVEKELVSANQKFPLFSSLHEGYAVIREEVEETGDEYERLKEHLESAWKYIKANDTEHALQHLHRASYIAQYVAIETCQVSAMCLKAIQSAKEDEP